MADGSLTRETPAPGVVVYQPRRGFRYGAEAFWLVGFALEGGAPTTALDLGTGSGIMALLLAARGVRSVGLDSQSEWRSCWEASLAESVVPGSVRLDVHDVALSVTGTFDLVVSNPPFFPAHTGPVSPDPLNAVARTESTAGLADFVRTGAAALKPGGRLCFVVPVERGGELSAAGAVHHLVATRRVQVGQKRVLVELRDGSGSNAEFEHIDESDDRTTRWYALARGRST